MDIEMEQFGEKNSSKSAIKQKVRPLHTIERVFMWLCLLSADVNTTSWTKLSYIFLSCTIFTTFTMFLIASIVSLLRYPSVSLEASLYVLFQISGILPLNTMILISFCFRHKILKIFQKLANIYADSKSNIILTWVCQISFFFLT